MLGIYSSQVLLGCMWTRIPLLGEVTAHRLAPESCTPISTSRWLTGRVRTKTFTLSVSEAIGRSSSAAGMMSCRGGRRRSELLAGDRYGGEGSLGLRRMGRGVCRGYLSEQSAGRQAAGERRCHAWEQRRAECTMVRDMRADAANDVSLNALPGEEKRGAAHVCCELRHEARTQSDVHGHGQSMRAAPCPHMSGLCWRSASGRAGPPWLCMLATLPGRDGELEPGDRPRIRMCPGAVTALEARDSTSHPRD